MEFRRVLFRSTQNELIDSVIAPLVDQLILGREPFIRFAGAQKIQLYFTISLMEECNNGIGGQDRRTAMINGQLFDEAFLAMTDRTSVVAKITQSGGEPVMV